jgi:hypothetical protein
MSTFGGLTFNSNQQISDFVNNNSQDFTSMVKSYSALLAPITETAIINKILQESYPRIGMKLAAAKNLNNTYLFADVANPSDLSILFNNVIDLISDPDSPFSEGLVSVAARYAAASFISALPLDGDIKNVTLSKELHKQAYDDLEDIVELYLATSSLAPSTKATEKKNTTLYIALGIDPLTLPASYFNVSPPSESIEDLLALYPNASVKSLSSLTLPPNTIGVGEVLTTSEQSNGGSLVQESFFIKTGDDEQDLLDNISSIINSNTSLRISNIIASPNSNSNLLTSTNVIKKKVYESDPADPTGIYDKKIIKLDLLTNLSYLNFDARVKSPINNRELIIFDFYTIDRAAVSLDINPSSTYRGDYSPSSNYLTNDVVTYRDIDYIATSDSTGILPTDTAFWTRLYLDSNDLISRYKRHPSTKNYIEGLLYGLESNYSNLDKIGPLSLILDVENGNVSSTLSQEEQSKRVINTIYFRQIDPTQPVDGILKVRVSSASNSLIEEFEIEAVQSSADLIALELVNKLFALKGVTSRSNSQGSEETASDILGGLVQSNAVQITAFKYTFKTVKVVLDVGIDGNIPINLEIATGDIYEERTRYSPRPRSLIVEAQPEKQFSLLQTENLNIDNNYVYSVKTVKMDNNSVPFQSARDRINLLRGL